jgi:nuclear pore complex protein Nup133
MYEIDEQRPAAEFWTASDAILDALEELYTTTWHTLLARSRLYGTSIDAADRTDQNQKDQTVLKTQLADLAAVICANMEDKIRTHSQ